MRVHRFRGPWSATFILTVGVGGSSSANSGAGVDSVTLTGADVPELVRFDSTMVSFMRRHDIRGGALVVARDGRVLLERG